MTKYFFVLAHPEAKSCCASMYNAAVAACIAAGHEVKVSDLYAMNFNPVTSRANFKSVKNPDFFKPQAEEAHASTIENGYSDELETEMQKLEWCDILVFQFPMYWFSMPAILKGWCDRVLASGRIYGGSVGMYGSHKFQKGEVPKRALLSLTTGGPEPGYLPGGFNGDWNGILRPIHRGIFEFCGFTVLAPNLMFGAAQAGDEVRKVKIQEWADRAPKLAEEQPFVVGNY